MASLPTPQAPTAGNFALARYNSDGSLDTTFDGDGFVTTAIDSGFKDKALAIQSDGKIVAVGVELVGADQNFALIRYNSTGTLDAAFDGDGIVTTDFGPSSGAADVAIQADGKIVGAGFVIDAGVHKFAVARYNSNGSLDTTFGTGGLVTTAVGSLAEAAAVAIQADGKIVAAGGTDGEAETFVLIRYNSTGTLDTTFGTGGIVTIALGSAFAHDVAIQADGKIVAAGGEFALARFNSAGSLDNTFGTGGRVFTAIGSASEAKALAIQPDGKIVAAGVEFVGAFDGNFALARYDAGAITGGAVTLSDTSAGVQTAGTVAFTLANPVASGQSIVLTFPAGWTVFDGSMTATNWTGLDGATPTSVTGDATARTVTIVLSADQNTLSETLTILASAELVNQSTRGTGLTLFIDATGELQGTSSTFDITAHTQWTQLVPTGTAPVPRGAYSAVYDAGSNTMVVFGGRGTTNNLFNDAWRLLDANGDTSPQWQPVNVSGGLPAPRWIHQGVYDSDTDRMIVHGGGLGFSSPCSDQTWGFD